MDSQLDLFAAPVSTVAPLRDAWDDGTRQRGDLRCFAVRTGDGDAALLSYASFAFTPSLSIPSDDDPDTVEDDSDTDTYAFADVDDATCEPA